MELSKELQAEIVEIFRKVEYGQITFKLSPEKKTLDYSVETTGKIIIDERRNMLDKKQSTCLK